MGYLLHEKEFDQVRRLPPLGRYEYFIKRVADSQSLWSLWSDGWALMGDDEGEAVPVWPHPRFAEAFATGEWDGYSPQRIGLDDWLAKWIPGMETDRRRVAVFPAEGATTKATPAQLRHDLEREMAKYGDDETA